METTASYKGDEIYKIDCTGDCVVGDEVRFQRALFTGSWRNAKFNGFEIVTGKIIKESYGEKKQQHTFTIQCSEKKIKIKGRNLYGNGTWRIKWSDESTRHEVAKEKHERGNIARENRLQRLSF